jgi:DNA-binding transcriptional LysR family regulator
MDVDLVAEGYDVAIRLGDMKDSRLVARRPATTRRLIFAAPSYLAGRDALREPDDLLRHDCLCFTRLATHPVWQLHRDGKSRAVRLSGRLEADDAEAVVKAALAGAGINHAWASRCAASRWAWDGKASIRRTTKRSLRSAQESSR